jgi:hypothetical protein
MPSPSEDGFKARAGFRERHPSHYDFDDVFFSLERIL